MTITYRTVKGSPLTWQELDNNFGEVASLAQQMDIQYDDFVEKYLGPYATDPVSGMVEGSLYFNTTSDELLVYNGSIWVSLSSGSVDINDIVPTQTGNNGKVLGTNGTVVSWVSGGGGGSPGGSDTHVQFNDGGSFGGEADFTYDKTTNTLTLSGTPSGNIVTGASTSGIYKASSDGSAAAPAFSFSSDLDTGMFRVGVNTLGLSAGSNLKLSIEQNDIIGRYPNGYGMKFYSQNGSVHLGSITNNGDNAFYIGGAGTNPLQFGTNGTAKLQLSTTYFSSSVPFLAADGTLAAPSYSFFSDSDTGFYLESAGILRGVIGGARQFELSSSGAYFPKAITAGEAIGTDQHFLMLSNATYYLNMKPAGTMTASRDLTFNVNDANRAVSLFGNLTVSSAATISGTNTGDQTLNSLLPTQTGNNGKALVTDGTNATWQTVSGGGGSGEWQLHLPPESWLIASGASYGQDGQMRGYLLLPASTAAEVVTPQLHAPAIAGTLKCRVTFRMASATSGDINLNVAVEAIADADNFDTDAGSSWDTNNASGAISVPGTTAGRPKTFDVTLTNNDGLAAGEMFRLRIQRPSESNDMHILAISMIDEGA